MEKRRGVFENPANLESILNLASSHQLEPIEYAAGETILEQDQVNNELIIIVRGQARLLTHTEDHGQVTVDTLEAGAFLGLISFWTRMPISTHSIAETHVVALPIHRKDFDAIRKSDAEINRVIDFWLIENLCHRVQRMITVTTQNKELTRKLEQERRELSDTVRELKSTRNSLIHAERLAVMGQVVAGVAHEINNPSASVKQNTVQMREHIETYLKQGKDRFTPDQRHTLFTEGYAHTFLEGSAVRKRLEDAERRFQDLPRSLLRRIAHFSADALSIAMPKNRIDLDRLQAALRYFEAGVFLRNIEVSNHRISDLVITLKNYGRSQGTSREPTDLNQCINETCTMLNHRLKRFHLDRSEMQPLPRVLVSSSEINQVLTNLIVNACDATPADGTITLRSFSTDRSVVVQVADTGAGIPLDKLATIFEANFTTKHSGNRIGLGLGLTISRDIAEKHSGRLEAQNLPKGGAQFTLTLPRHD